MVTIDEIRQLFKEGYSKGFDFQRVCVAASPTVYRISDQSIPIAVMQVKAKRGNAGQIFVGFSEEMKITTGTELIQGAPITLPIDDANKVFIVATDAADGVEVICLV